MVISTVKVHVGSISLLVALVRVPLRFSVWQKPCCVHGGSPLQPIFPPYPTLPENPPGLVITVIGASIVEAASGITAALGTKLACIISHREDF